MLKSHISEKHNQTMLSCSFCDFKAVDEGSLGDHVLSKDGDSAIITIVGNQQIVLNDAMTALQQNTELIWQSILQGQNYLKSEILLLREELSELKDVQIQKKKEEDKKKDADKQKEEDKKKEDMKQKEDMKKQKKVQQKGQTGDEHTEKMVEEVAYKKNKLHIGEKNITKKPYSEAVKNKSKSIKNMVWIGTSVSKVLDQKKFEKDTNTNLKVVKAYGIKKEQNHRFPASNFTDTVPKVIKNENPDAIILQTGSIEITNIDVKKALMDPNNNIEEYKAEWTRKVKDDSANLFNLAKAALKMKPDMEVVIVKRLPRYDPKSQDPIHIKTESF